LAKFKHRCLGTVPWDYLNANDRTQAIRHLATRGKNKLFLHLVLGALQIDTEKGPLARPDFKRAFTSKAVREIHEAVITVWPDFSDLQRVLAGESGQTSGLYIGMYEPARVERGLTRHSLYADRILLVDPILDARRVSEQFNPLLHPGMHRTSTLKSVTLWLTLMPWIEQGLVGFVRAPGDLNPELERAADDRTRSRHERHPELATLIAASAKSEAHGPEYDEFMEDVMLTMPDDQMARKIREEQPGITEDALNSFLEHIRRRRDDHSYHLAPEAGEAGRNELMMVSTGTNYEQAKLISTITDSYVMTDLAPRWREIELDREDSGFDFSAWTPFAKAFQDVPFKFLDGVPLDAALALRAENRLEGLRSFLRRTWDHTPKAEPFAPSAPASFAAELEGEVRAAEAEWTKIEAELVSMVTKQGATLAFGAASLIATGTVGWGAAVLAIAGAIAGGGALSGGLKMAGYKTEYPASFFVDLRDGKYS